jgi:hypothetical protein
MSKGTATSSKMMPRMETYGGQNNPGYEPPSGSAGSSAFGEYTHKKNPMRVPEKGSQIGPGYGNADRMKAMAHKNEQEKKESLRGQPC